MLNDAFVYCLRECMERFEE